MKKLISFVMTAAMVASLIPATAFAATGDISATAKVIDAIDLGKGDDKEVYPSWSGFASGPELQIKITSADYQQSAGVTNEMEVRLYLDNAQWSDRILQGGDAAAAIAEMVLVREETPGTFNEANGDPVTDALTVSEVEEDSVLLTFQGNFDKDDIIAIDMDTVVTKTSVGAKATVSVESDMVDADDLVFATVVDKGIKASIRKMVDVAIEERATLNRITIEPLIGAFKDTDEITLKLSKGFEFVGTEGRLTGIDDFDYDGDVTIIIKPSDGADKIEIEDLQIEATSAKSGSVASIKVSQRGDNTVTLEAAKVVDYTVEMSVDEDEDIPVIYSGVDSKNTGITDGSDHLSLEVTVEESFPGAWSMRRGFDFTLPEGVYVTGVEVLEADNFYRNGVEVADQVGAWEDAFFEAYRDGDHKNFAFGKRIFDDVNVQLADKPAAVTFQLELVAEPTFEGKVVLGFEGDLVEETEVTIAKFVKPYKVKAEQNDIIIDYRNTPIPTAIVVTEAEEGLWSDGNDAAEFKFSIDRGDYIQFERDATFEVNKDSDGKVKDTTTTGSSKNSKLAFTVKTESDDEPMEVTIKDMELFLNRSVPAGAYDLSLITSMEEAFLKEVLFAADGFTEFADESLHNAALGGDHDDCNSSDECFVGDVEDYSNTVKEAFVNIVTAGRDQDDASFTTKVIVPVGEYYLISGATKVELDAPAYITASGYTMLPVRAVAKALGINNNNVLWNREARTVSILYGQRIITMTIGEKVVYVNGAAIPATAAVEISKERAFLGMRDLGIALGVTDIVWDAATGTATLNGSGDK